MHQLNLRSIATLIFLTIVIISGKAQQNSSVAGISHKDHFVQGSDGVRLFVREFESPHRAVSDYPLLMVHGGGPGALASFDIDLTNGSFAKDLVRAGFKVFIMDIRGWEHSTLPDYDTTDPALVAGNVEEAASDIGHVVEFIKSNEKVNKVSYFGWATGGHWGGFYAANNPENLAYFISLNSLYGVHAPWELRQFFAKDTDSTRYNRQGHFRSSGKEGLVRKWHETIPLENKDEWRDPRVMEGYRETAMSFGGDTTVMTVPGGYREESFYMSLGKKYWDAKDIRVPSLIIRTELDFWSRPEDLQAIEKDLSAPGSQFLTIPGTHYVFLDRATKGKSELVKAITEFARSQDN